MNTLDPQTITRLLRDVRAGEAGAAQSLLPVVYAELHGLANVIFSTERNGHTLQPTALIHEAWLKLAPNLAPHGMGFEDRRHFMIVASRAMRQVMADHARTNGRQKRGDGWKRVTLDGEAGMANEDAVNLVDLDDSLNRLADLQPRHAQVVELRILGGLTIAETAEALGVSHNTVEGDWFMAKAWLRKELGQAG